MVRAHTKKRISEGTPSLRHVAVRIAPASDEVI